ATHREAAHKRNGILAIVFHCHCKFINYFIYSIELVELIFNKMKFTTKQTVNKDIIELKKSL
ncbi:MAG: hypothetical protein ABI850_19205, partial [Flavobacterium sp.]